MKVPKELKDLLYLLHDGIVDLADDNKWCKEFTKDFNKLFYIINWEE